MTAKMSKLQKKTEEEGLDVQYLSYSVDPEVDTPEVLKEFGSRFDINYRIGILLRATHNKK
ncbi:MAG: SCO family protein [Bacillota bacterium]|nr:SCO family protein [Bacillota bacterium]